MKYFNNIQCIEDLQSQYRTLALKFHPDKGGDEVEFIAMKDEFDSLFLIYKDIFRREDGTIYTDHTKNKGTAMGFRAIVDILINLDGICVDLVGWWLWVSGDTYPHKDIFVAIGLEFSSKHKMWFYSGSGSKKGYRASGKNWDQIVDTWGGRNLSDNTKKQSTKPESETASVALLA
jgi:hypothetical protein